MPRNEPESMKPASATPPAPATPAAPDLAPTPPDQESERKEPVCPHCGGPLQKHGHDNPHKAGASHCNACGCCFAPGLHHVRPGASSCALAVKAD